MSTPHAGVARLFYGSFFLALGAGIAGWGGALAAWPAAGFAGFGAAYLAGRPDLLGKRSDGALAPWAGWLYLPVRALLLGISGVEARLTSEAPWHEVAPGLALGRRLPATDLPPGTRHVVDLTAELPADPAIPAGLAYTVLPTLDATPPPPPVLADLVGRLRDAPGPLYVHCAQGHGRSALVAAALLLARDLVSDPAAAEDLLRARRPGVRLNRAQRAALAGWWSRISGGEPGTQWVSSSSGEGRSSSGRSEPRRWRIPR